MVIKCSNALSVCSFSLHFHSYYISNVIAHINSPKINVKAWIFPKILLNILTKVYQIFSWIEAGKHLKRSDKKRVRKLPQRYADERDIEFICLALWALWETFQRARSFWVGKFNDLSLNIFIIFLCVKKTYIITAFSRKFHGVLHCLKMPNINKCYQEYYTCMKKKRRQLIR